MMHALTLLAVVALAFVAANAMLGYPAAYELGYGAITLMGAMISLTFIWLYFQRTTALAIGMAFSWAGTASVMGWWWIFNLLGRPQAMQDHHALFVFLSFSLAGAILHFGVIQRSMGVSRGFFTLPVAAAFLVSALVHLLV